MTPLLALKKIEKNRTYVQMYFQKASIKCSIYNIKEECKVNNLYKILCILIRKYLGMSVLENTTKWSDAPTCAVTVSVTL